jgi:hypothetical protein
MVLKNAQMNHESNNIHEALPLSKRQRERCRERVFFATMANGLQSSELYGDDEESCPPEMSTKSGDLTRTLQLINDPLEYEYTLLTFLKLHGLAHESMEKYLAMNSKNLSKSERSKIELMLNLHDLVVRQKAEEEEGMTAEFVVTPKSLFDRADLVKSSHYNWETYFNMVKAKNFYYLLDEDSEPKQKGSDFDIDDMLRNVFNDDNDD